MRHHLRLLLQATAWAICVSGLAEAAEVSGWRGDGSGRYPDANPPLDWGRIAPSVKQLSAQSAKPKAGSTPAAETAVPDGVIRQWLVLGPLPIDDETNVEDLLPGVETLSPDEDVKAGKDSWRAVKLETSCLDLCSTLHVAPTGPDWPLMPTATSIPRPENPSPGISCSKVRARTASG